MLRRVLLALALVGLLVVSIEPRMLQMLFIDRESFARELSESPDLPLPAYPRFLEGVRAHTQPGDTIAIIIPRMSWDNGYMYAYYRASYFLAGREVLPLISPENEKLPQNFRAARYIAAFRMNVRTPAEVVWRGERGTLLRPIWTAGDKSAAIHPESQR